MNPRTIFAAVLISVLWAVNAPAYEVWMGTHLMRHADATNLAAWSTVARQLEGINVNRSPHDTDPASNDDWRTIFKQFPNARNWMTEFPRSAATRDPAKTNELARFSIEDHLQDIFGYESTFGYDLTILMFYDERGEFLGNEYLYEWTVPEVQIIRDWLDSHGRADVQLMWNVRNNSTRARDFAKHPLVDLVEIEASTTALLGNQNNQITFANWFWTNAATINKRLAFQIPRVLPGDPLDQYEGTRRVVKLLGDEFGYGENGVRSSRLVIMPVTYNDNYLYLPETTAGGMAYHNRLTSICLSLLEQRSLFEGRTRLPTTADADSTTRLFAPTTSSLPDQIVPQNTVIGPLAFTIGDDLTAPSALTLIKESSNTNLVPLANIVLGGSGSNRTVTVTPVVGQSGSALINIWVSDGTLATPVTFTVTVLPPGIIPGTLYSSGPDCSIKEDLAIEKLPDATLDVGCRGSSPFVERCTVYVFQLPDLGAVNNPFTAATFSFNFISKNTTLRGHDLYGLGRRMSSTVLPGDYYATNSVADPTDATRLQQSILTDSTPVGLISTAGGGSANLLAYLNTQYAGGAGAGDYVFLRINTRSPKTGSSYATLTMSEGGVAGQPDTRPRITYEAMGNTAPTISALADQTIPANTNTGPLAFTVGDNSTPPGSITLTKNSSNTGLVPVANIAFGGSGSNRTVTVTPAPDQSGSAIISVIASDGSLSATNTFTLTVLPPGTLISTLYSDLADSGPRQIDGQPPSILGITASDATLFAGRSGTGGTVDRCVVFPFQLPALGMKTNPFTAASFAFNLISNDFAPTNCNLDLYGLSSRAAATVLASDYYSETDVPDPTPGTTRLQNNLCTPATAAGNISNSPASGSALVSYLNTQYAGGTNAGRWVFLRLGKDALVGTSAKKYTVMAANGASTNNAGLPDYTVWPRIQFTALPASPTNLAAVTPSFSNGLLDLTISGDPAFHYTVQASTNLVDWTSLLVTNSPALPFNWTDTNAHSFTNRFYRVLLGP